MSDEIGRRAVRKRRAGEKLTKAEEAAFKTYMRQHTQRSALVYFPSLEDLAHYKALAEEKGYSTFSKFVVEMLYVATTGNMVDPEFIQDLRDQVEELKEKAERERDETEHYRERARELEEKVEEYAEVFFKLAQEKAEEAA